MAITEHKKHYRTLGRIRFRGLNTAVVVSAGVPCPITFPVLNCIEHEAGESIGSGLAPVAINRKPALTDTCLVKSLESSGTVNDHRTDTIGKLLCLLRNPYRFTLVDLFKELMAKR